MHLKLFQKEHLKKTVEATGDFIRDKIADKIINFWKLYHIIIQK